MIIWNWVRSSVVSASASRRGAWAVSRPTSGRWSSVIADPGVEHTVKEVGDQVRPDHQNTGDDQEGHHGERVVLGDRLGEEGAEAARAAHTHGDHSTGQ